MTGSAYSDKVELFENTICRWSLKGNSRDDPFLVFTSAERPSGTLSGPSKQTNKDDMTKLHHDLERPGGELKALEAGKGQA